MIPKRIRQALDLKPVDEVDFDLEEDGVRVQPARVSRRLKGVLAASVAAPGDVAPVIAASVVHRLVIMVGEVVMIGASRLRARRLSKISRSA